MPSGASAWRPAKDPRRAGQKTRCQRSSGAQMRFLVGYHVLCGCVTAALSMQDATDKHISDFVRSMINSGRAVRPSDDIKLELVSCPHRGASTVTGDA